MDPSGNHSSTNEVSFHYIPKAIQNIPSATLEVLINGNGKIDPNDNGQLLALGANYTLTASPGHNWIFSNWVASGSESFISTNPVLKFSMQSNLVLEANFVTNVFLAAQGTYRGLFAPTNSARQQTNSGSFLFSVTSGGAVSGNLDLGGQTVPLSGKFDLGGTAEIVSKRPTGTFADHDPATGFRRSIGQWHRQRRQLHRRIERRPRCVQQFGQSDRV